jgi:hypothetical protein
MVPDFVSNLFAAVVAAAIGLLWRGRACVRGAIEIGRFALGHGRRVRVSYCAVLRVREADRVCLFRSASRPEAFGPPGGVIKYRDSARAELDRLSFADDVWPGRAAEMRRDLRGYLPARSVPGFRRWFRAGLDRESIEECLRRELGEELVEIGLGDLVPTVAGLNFIPARAVTEGPRRVPGQDYLQVRRFDVCDLSCDTAATADFHRRLIEAGDDPRQQLVCCARVQEVNEGRCHAGLIAPHTAYLVRAKKLASDLPPIQKTTAYGP